MAASSDTLAHRVWPAGASVSWPRGFALALAGSFIVAISAQINVPLPFVPITMQTLAVLAVGTALGSRLGTAALALYLLEGAVGLPVFAQFKGGLPVLFGPTGGYLIGFVIAAGLVGWLAERGFDRTSFRMFIAAILGTVLIYVPGLLWLAPFTGTDKVLELGLYPFLLGDLLKAALAALLFPALWKMVGPR